jgi:signal transduction histidine kinase/ActR/RegA family two-component response regulator
MPTKLVESHRSVRKSPPSGRADVAGDDDQPLALSTGSTPMELAVTVAKLGTANEELLSVNADLLEKNEQLARLNDDFRNLLDATQIATVFLDRDLCITLFTPAMTELFHLRQADLGRPITDIVTRTVCPDLSADAAAALSKQETVDRHVQLVENAGSFLMKMRPYQTMDKAVGGVVITFVDVTQSKRLLAEEELRALNRTLEQRVTDRTVALEAVLHALKEQTEERLHAEEMLRQAQKLEAIGKLTGGVAHDFNNLLGVIIGNTEFLLDAVRDDPDQLELAHEILHSALSGAELTRRLLAFARMQPLQPQFINLNTFLSGQVAMLGRTLGDSIKVTATLAPDIGLIHADPSQIGNALLNLAINARDAMPDGGKLTIETANAHLHEQSVAENSDMNMGDFIVLAVKDTGIGMSSETLERATEPFFTTKPPSAGTGLGLSMIYGFAKQSGGHLKIDSEVGVGTTVRLYLPRTQDHAVTGSDMPQAESSPPDGNESILLVDDNMTLRHVAQRHLTALGYNVSTASSGPAALAILRSGVAFDLLFTDVVMPEGMSGYDLADAARALHPELKVLFTTGYNKEQTLAGDGLHHRQQVLRKPYRQRDLAMAVRAVLDEHMALPGGNPP